MSAAPAITLENVTKRFNGSPAVDNLSFAVARGEIVALVGRTGAGKSTALHMIMGVMPPDEGSVEVEGLDPYRRFRDLRGRLSVSFQTDRLLPWRTAEFHGELRRAFACRWRALWRSIPLWCCSTRASASSITSRRPPCAPTSRTWFAGWARRAC